MDFLNLLMQSLSAQGGAVDEEEDLSPEELAEFDRTGNVVTGMRNQEVPRPNSQNPNYGDPAPREEIQPRYVLNDDRMPPTEEEMKEIIPRRNGYWGTKGSLRNILGTLSDAFLVQGGEKPMYRELREKERKGDAMFGFTKNPQQAMERMAAQGFTDDAEELYKTESTRDYQRANLESQDAGRKSQIADRAADNKDKDFNRIARMTVAGLPYPQLVALGKTRGISEEELNLIGITPDMTEEQRKQVGSYDMSTNQTLNLPFTERRVQAQEQNADSSSMNAASSRIRANRPPAGRAPRAATDEERLERAYNTPAAQRTEYQKSLIERKNKTGRGSGRNSERRAVTPPTPRPGWGVKPLPN